MKKKHQLKALLAALMLASFGQAFAATTDTIQAPTGYFAPSDAQKYDSPYYRWVSEDWSWTHSAMAGPITTATLNISAFDVDASAGEVDNIFAFDTATSSWSLLGSLAGANDIWSYSTFNLGSNWFDEINSGLQVKIAIDANQAGWAVTLSKSVLSIDGGDLPPPNPVPVPAAAWLLGSGLLGLAGVARRKAA